DERFPSDVGVFLGYVDEMVAALEVGGEARLLAELILRPPVPVWAEPARALQGIITIGLLPSRLRDGFRFAWSAGRARTFRVACSAARAGQRVIPSSLTTWRYARVAARRTAA